MVIVITALAVVVSVGLMLQAVSNFGLQEAWHELVLNVFYIACLVMIGMYFIPEFTYGSAKYPEMMTVIPETILTRFNIKPTSGSMVAAFVGEECRGTATISATGSTSLLIRCRTQGELITLKYYDNTEKKLYTIRDIANL